MNAKEPSAWVKGLRGRFVVFDGPDGSGKSTQFRRFADFVAREAGGAVAVCEVREPGGTAIGEQIRKVLLDPANAAMDLRTEMLLYMASRAQVVAERIEPALARGEFVLADRFISSTLAYQGAAGGMPSDDIRAVGRIVCGRTAPDLTVVFDVDEDTAAKRLNPLLDRMEQKGREFHRRVRQGYLQQVKDEPERYAVVDARLGEKEVFETVVKVLRRRLGEAQRM